MPVCFCAAIACKEAMRALMLLFKGFASDLVTLQFRQFQLAALNGFFVQPFCHPRKVSCPVIFKSASSAAYEIAAISLDLLDIELMKR